ncbi:MAG: hypothetical protein OXG70_03315, partial [Cyanobacteria bacterium MAG IRC1_bin_28]|nr:hypothetical protein [Cyanobacteria bacterium MAG IRC1_bin_28]
MNLLSHNPLCHNTDTIDRLRSTLENMLGKQLVCEKLVTDNGVVQPAAVTSASAQDMPYAPISSVWEGSDAELLEEMFRFYPSIPVEPILDATHNAGRFWRNSNRQVVSMDIDPQYKPMIVADNRNMVGVEDASFGVVVYDPPHVGPQGRDKSCKRFDVDFGATMPCGASENWTLSYLYPPFLKEARRVLKPEGLLLAKITDMVNNHRSRWAHCDFMRMADEAGFTVCDLIIKIRNGPMVSNRWKTDHHARKQHCFWIICRNGHHC